MTPSPITVFGGAGFVGRYVVRRLVAEGAAVRVAVRHPERSLFLKTMGDIGQVSLVYANVLDEKSVGLAVRSSKAVVNTVGILFQRGRQNFKNIHVDGARKIASAARASSVETLVHISAIGAATESPAHYARTKALGEIGVREDFPGAIIIRPSIVFGAEDDFFNRFATLARLFPIIPLIEGGTKFQPVYVDDLANACVHLMNIDAEIYDENTKPMQGHINIGSGEDITIKELAYSIAEVVNFQGSIEFDVTKPDGSPRKLINSSKMKSFGWSPTVDLKTGLTRTYNDYCSNL